jgi:hypothetical protein
MREDIHQDQRDAWRQFGDGRADEGGLSDLCQPPAEKIELHAIHIPEYTSLGMYISRQSLESNGCCR